MQLSIRHIKALLVACIFSTILIGCEKEPFPDIDLPIYPKAIEPQKAINSPAEGAKGVAYRVEIPFPPDEITQFYDQKLNEMGFVPYLEDKAGPRQWESFNYKSGEFEPTDRPPGRYLAHWVDQEKTTRIWLVIFYKYDGQTEEWVSKPMVSISVAKLFKMPGQK